MHRRAAGLAILAAVISACGKKKVRVAAPSAAKAPPAPAPVGKTERGVASWYGKPYDGRPAADGEIYDMEAMVAAHRTLPFQTRVSVRNVSNGKTVEVRIIDRGPFAKGRIIDLSHAAAKAIDLIGPGVAEVEVTVLGGAIPAAEAAARFGVQVGAFREKANADRLQQSLAAAYGAARIVLRAGDPPLYRVLAGSEPTEEAAEALATRLRGEQNIPQAFVVRLDP